jgi:hypothetical protein
MSVLYTNKHELKASPTPFHQAGNSGQLRDVWPDEISQVSSITFHENEPMNNG